MIETVKNNQTKHLEDIETIVNHVKEMPEVREQCARAIDVRTERDIAKFDKQRKEQEEKKQNLVQLSHIIEKNPQATIHMNNIESATINIKK